MGEFLDKLKDWWDDFSDELQEVIVAFIKGVSRETICFVLDNKEFIATTILEIATSMATASGADKRREALNRIGDNVANNIPNMKVSNGLLNFALEYVYRGLKDSGQI